MARTPMTDYRVPPSACLDCGYVMDGCMGVTDSEPAREGNITVCINCGHIMAFAADLTLRALTDEEIRAVAGDPLILRIQRARAAAITRDLRKAKS